LLSWWFRFRGAAALAIDRAAIASVWNQAPTDQLLPPVLPGFADRQFYALRGADADKAEALVHGRRVTVTMAVFKDCAPCSREAEIIRAELGQAGIRVRLKMYDNAFEAAREPGAKIDILDSGTGLEYPDSASFLARMLLEDTPSGWVTEQVRREVAKLSALSSSERQSSAAELEID
jgi:ABC-type transport system substrate-binding protein